MISGETGIFTTPSGKQGAMLRAYEKATGKGVGAVYMPLRETGSPMTYMVGGKQDVVPSAVLDSRQSSSRTSCRTRRSRKTQKPFPWVGEIELPERCVDGKVGPRHCRISYAVFWAPGESPF